MIVTFSFIVCTLYRIVCDFRSDGNKCLCVCHIHSFCVIVQLQKSYTCPTELYNVTPVTSIYLLIAWANTCYIHWHVHVCMYIYSMGKRAVVQCYILIPRLLLPPQRRARDRHLGPERGPRNSHFVGTK